MIDPPDHAMEHSLCHSNSPQNHAPSGTAREYRPAESTGQALPEGGQGHRLAPIGRVIWNQR
jgi:hypothetical protein